MLNFYEAFAFDQGGGDPAALRRVVDSLWDGTTGTSPAVVPAGRFYEVIESIRPQNGVVYESVYATAAIDACHIVEYAVDVLVKCDNDAAVEAALVAQEIVEMYLAMANQPLFVIDDVDCALRWSGIVYTAYPLMAAEVAKQEYDLGLLASVDEVTATTKRELVERGAVRVSPVRRFRLRVNGGAWNGSTTTSS